MHALVCMGGPRKLSSCMWGRVHALMRVWEAGGGGGGGIPMHRHMHVGGNPCVGGCVHALVRVWVRGEGIPCACMWVGGGGRAFHVRVCGQGGRVLTMHMSFEPMLFCWPSHVVGVVRERDEESYSLSVDMNPGPVSMLLALKVQQRCTWPSCSCHLPPSPWSGARPTHS